MSLVVVATLLLIAAAVTGYFGYRFPERRSASFAQMLTAGLLAAFAGVVCLAFYYGSADWTILKSDKSSGDAVASHIPSDGEARESASDAVTGDSPARRRASAASPE